jgi:hypothetical protein
MMATYRISASNVIGHRDTKATECPGRNMNLALVRTRATQILAREGIRIDDPVQTAGIGGELLYAVNAQ